VIFHSLDFVVFFVLVVAAYWRLGHRGQNVLLLVSSYFFYGYIHPWFLSLIGASTVIDYLSARGMERWPERKRLFMGASIVSNFGMLGFFKYFNFFVENVHAALAGLGMDVGMPVLRVLLPVGISFYTFQAMSYTVDVFRGELRARRSLLDVAVFISFFPHLVAGPIQRASFLLPQVEEKRHFSVDRAASGFYLMVWGFFKKLVIADNVGVIANKVFALSDPSFEVLWAGVFAFAIQIYADFSAYTDIARGSSRWLGFELTQNFDHPYMARNPADFWRRWNISLSTWFRDYVYIPLGGSREGELKWARNIIVTFLLSGLWHGASWNYVLWGLYHGVLLVLTRAHEMLGKPRTGPRTSDLGPRLLLQIPAMFVLTLVGWLLFRETEFSAIVRDLRLSPFDSTPFERQAGLYLFLLAFGYSIPLWVQSIWVELHRGEPEPAPARWPVAVLRALACGAAFAAILVLRSRTSLDFIYFQF
jgi:D-alanyl-lipoteichoic acid acyltransferase DltB (MBOAT superfamily)